MFSARRAEKQIAPKVNESGTSLAQLSGVRIRRGGKDSGGSKSID
jgi:hypothetical protein